MYNQFLKRKPNTSKVSHAMLASLCLSIVFLWTTLTTDNAEIYIFPKLLSIMLCILTFILWITENSAGNIHTEKSLLRGIIISFLYIFLLTEIGFYLTSFITFLLIITVYSNNTDTNIWRVISIKAIITFVFILVLYLLFSILLQVRVPSGTLFTFF